MSSKISLFSKAPPFSEEYNANHKAIHGAAALIFTVMAVVMMAQREKE